MLDISEDCGDFDDDARFGTIVAVKNLESLAMITNKFHTPIPGNTAGKIDNNIFWIISYFPILYKLLSPSPPI